MLVVIGALGKDHLRHPVGQSAEGRTRSAMVHDHAARWEDLRLRDETFDSSIRWKRLQLGRILIASDGRHHVDRLIRQRQ